MKYKLSKKFYTSFTIALLSSLIIGKYIYKSHLFFIFSLGFFGALYLLLSWLFYLKVDSLVIFQNDYYKKLKSMVSRFDRQGYKRKGIYAMDEENLARDTPPIGEDPTNQSCFSYLCCGLLLLVLSQLLPFFL